jgi:hypothetical protein
MSLSASASLTCISRTNTVSHREPSEFLLEIRSTVLLQKLNQMRTNFEGANMKTEILKKLENIALERTIPFCMSCYIKAPQGICPSCHSDDLAKWMDEVGLDWSLNFAIEHILQEELTPVNLDEVFEDMIRSCYLEETVVGWMKFDTVDLMKSQDPISWKIARDECIEELESEDEIISFNNGASYYWKYDLEAL